MEVLIAWLVFCFVAAALAPGRGRRPGIWFLISFLFSPLVGIILVLALPSKKHEQAERAENANRRPCPRCGEKIARSASVCRFCNTEVTPLMA